MKELSRPKDDRVIAGVCAALAKRFGTPSWVMRLVFILGSFFVGIPAIIYIVLWVVIPSE